MALFKTNTTKKFSKPTHVSDVDISRKKTKNHKTKKSNEKTK